MPLTIVTACPYVGESCIEKRVLYSFVLLVSFSAHRNSQTMRSRSPGFFGGRQKSRGTSKLCTARPMI